MRRTYTENTATLEFVAELTSIALCFAASLTMVLFVAADLASKISCSTYGSERLRRSYPNTTAGLKRLAVVLPFRVSRS